MATTACRPNPAPTATIPPAPTGFVAIQPGEYRIGSTADQRRVAQTYGGITQADTATHAANFELQSTAAKTSGFFASIFPVTNREYAEFVAATGHRAPLPTKVEWQAESRAAGLGFDQTGDFERYVLPLAWHGGQPPSQQLDAPVVLVSRVDAMAYCAWKSKQTNTRIRLPDEIESEMLGGDSNYPWGEAWQLGRCHAGSDWRGPIAVGTPSGTPAIIDGFMTVWDTSSTGVRDYAGQVYEWTSTPDARSRGTSIVKGGGSWADGALECRRSSRRSVPDSVRHPLIGFRVVMDP